MKKKVVTVGVAALLGVLAARPVQARDFAQIYVECGLGALIAPRTPAVAVITNIIWDLGTTAIISNASSPESCKGGKSETASFIYESYDLIEIDLASGGGQHLEMLATLVDMDASQRDGFLSGLREDFTNYVAQTDYNTQNRFEKSQALFDMVYARASG